MADAVSVALEVFVCLVVVDVAEEGRVEVEARRDKSLSGQNGDW